MEKGPMQIDMLSNPWLGYEVTDEYVKCLQLLALFFAIIVCNNFQIALTVINYSPEVIWRAITFVVY